MGSPTEVAIAKAAMEALGGDDAAKKLQEFQEKVFEIPFNSTNKWMLTIHKGQPDGKGFRTLLKGASERVLERCNLEATQRKSVNAKMEELMGQGKRVLCIAEKFINDKPADFQFKGATLEDVNFSMDGFTFCGLVAIEDPPKEGVPESVAKMRDAGTVTVMVTGDHPSTAKAIAKRIGIIDELAPGSDGNGAHLVVTGAELEEHMPSGDSFDVHDLETAMTAEGQASLGS